ncbi:MAG: 30S ribosomal protein S20 [Candidatus Zixiibacteriota bacterium]
MPHHKSCMKRLRKSAEEKVRNNKIKTLLKGTIKDARAKIDGGQAIDLNEAYSNIDKVWSKGSIHKKRAARLKSRMAKANAKLKTAASN